MTATHVRLPATLLVVAALTVWFPAAQLSVGEAPAARAASLNRPAATAPGLVSAVPGETPNVNDGEVKAIAQVGSTIVIGGSFTSVSPAGRAPVPAAQVAAFSSDTGQLIDGFAPSVNGDVTALAAGPSPDTVYIGGSFTRVDGMSTRLALVRVSTGKLVKTWSSPRLNNAVSEIELRGRQLWVAGSFTAAGALRRGGLAVLHPNAGAPSSYPVPPFTGHHNFRGKRGQAGGSVGVKSFDISPAGDALIAVGDFTSVGGRPRDQVARLRVARRGATLDRGWATLDYTSPCFARSYDSYVRGVRYSPDGSAFVVVDAGGPRAANSDGSKGLCDSAASFAAGERGHDVKPRWVDYTGRDSLLSVAVTTAAVYVGGHQRWMNNSVGHDDAREGAVPRPGLAALDPRNGLPLAWNPGRNPRGDGADALLVTNRGLYVGSDTEWIGNFTYQRKRIAFFPASGGKPAASDATGRLPGTVCLIVSRPTDQPARCGRWDGGSAAPTLSPVTGAGWSKVRGAFDVGGAVYYGLTDGSLHSRTFDGSGFGPAVAIDPYDDPVWSDVKTGSGDVYRGVPSDFYGDLRSVTSMFYRDGRVYYTLSGRAALYWRWFTPDSGVVGADRFTSPDRLDWSRVAGAFLSGNTLYYAESGRRPLYAVHFKGGRPHGSPTIANHSIDWSSRAAFVVTH